MKNLIVSAVVWLKRKREEIERKTAALLWFCLMVVIGVQEISYLVSLTPGGNAGLKFALSFFGCIFFLLICLAILNMLSKERMVEFFPGIYIENFIFRFPPEPEQLSLDFPEQTQWRRHKLVGH